LRDCLLGTDRLHGNLGFQSRRIAFPGCRHRRSFHLDAAKTSLKPCPIFGSITIHTLDLFFSLSRRSTVLAEIFISFSRTASLRFNCPAARRRTTSVRSAAINPCPHANSNQPQISASAVTTSAPQLPLRFVLGLLGFAGWARFRIKTLRAIAS